MQETNKIAVITGATGGIGTQICIWLLQNNYTVLAACRSAKKWDSLVCKIQNRENLIMVNCNLEEFDSIDAFVKDCIKLSGGKIDILINNAGMIAPAFRVTKDNYESSMQVNYLAPVKITEGLLPYIANGGKILNTISCTVATGKEVTPTLAIGEEFEKQKKEFLNLKNYSNTKYLLAKYTISLCGRVTELNKNILVCGIDPGVVNTGIITMHRWYDSLANIFFRPFIKSPQQGAVPAINAIQYKFTDNKNALLFKGNKVKQLLVK